VRQCFINIIFDKGDLLKVFVIIIDLWLTFAEYAFYSVLSENTSTKFLEDHKMKELIHVIVEKVRKNATVDWDKRDDVRVMLRLEV